MMIRTKYRQTLPHILPIGSMFFVTFRLHDSLPLSFLKKMTIELEAKVHEIRSSDSPNFKEEIYRQQKKFFQKYDEALDEIYNNVDYLKNKKVAQVVANKMHKYDGKLYKLLSYCIMPNHVHLVVDLSVQLENLDVVDVNNENYVQLDRIMQLIKGGSSYEINKILGRKGTFWQKESYDHYVRNTKELGNIIRYVEMNPVKAKLVLDWEDFEFTFCGY